MVIDYHILCNVSQTSSLLTVLHTTPTASPPGGTRGQLPPLYGFVFCLPIFCTKLWQYVTVFWFLNRNAPDRPDAAAVARLVLPLLHCVPKNANIFIFLITRSNLTDFNDFWHTASWRNLTIVDRKFAHLTWENVTQYLAKNKVVHKFERTLFTSKKVGGSEKNRLCCVAK